MTDPYAAAAASAARLAERTDCAEHDAAVVLGSGWLPAADALGPPTPRSPWPSWAGSPQPTVAGHAPVVRSVTVGGLRVLVFLGRTHLYEGTAGRTPWCTASGRPSRRAAGWSC